MNFNLLLYSFYRVSLSTSPDYNFIGDMTLLYDPDSIESISTCTGGFVSANVFCIKFSSKKRSNLS